MNANQSISDIMTMIVILKEKAVDDSRLLLLINSEVELVRKIAKAMLQDGKQHYLLKYCQARIHIIKSLRDEAELILQDFNSKENNEKPN